MDTVRPTVHPPPATKPFPIPKALIWLANFLLSPFVGVALYVVWRTEHPAASTYALKSALYSMLLWFVFIFGICALAITMTMSRF
jgi:hypothetical protein